MAKLIDLTGQRFGRLTVVERVLPNKGGNAIWRCQCDCGNEVDVWGSALRNGHTKSCGCFRSDTTKDVHTVHGKKNTRLYRIWLNMKNRCNNPNYHHFERYGGRGISVCSQWVQNFEAFFNWAIDNGYNDDLTLDRIDNNKGYSPDNCRWATPKEQSNNVSRNRLVTFNGETRNITQWREYLGLSKATVDYRLCHGWTPEEALGLVPRKK